MRWNLSTKWAFFATLSTKTCKSQWRPTGRRHLHLWKTWTVRTWNLQDGMSGHQVNFQCLPSSLRKEKGEPIRRDGSVRAAKRYIVIGNRWYAISERALHRVLHSILFHALRIACPIALVVDLLTCAGLKNCQEEDQVELETHNNNNNNNNYFDLIGILI